MPDDVSPPYRPVPTNFRIDRRAARLANEFEQAGEPDGMISTETLAELTETSAQFWEYLRCRGGGPPFIKISPRRVRYRRDDVMQWLRERTHYRANEYSAEYKSRGRPRGAKVIAGRVINPQPQQQVPEHPPIRRPR